RASSRAASRRTSRDAPVAVCHGLALDYAGFGVRPCGMVVALVVPRRSLMLLLTIALLACDTTSGEQPDQLEAPEAAYEQKDPYDGASITGIDAVVSGGDRDWSVAVTDGGTVPMVAFHVPGASDLSVLAGGSL